jgi:radical SAM enzyme (TIGR01210 family)
VEKERTLSGKVEEVITIFLTNRECRYACLMCDLWENTTDTTVPTGAIPRQIEWVLGQLPAAKHIKLYNSANFFDPGSIPTDDYDQIATLLEPFETVIVENHPLLTGERCIQFAGMIRPGLQVAMGLETVHPGILSRLNKKMNKEDYRRSVHFLKQYNISTRTFILLRPPFQSEAEGIYWAKETLTYAFESGTDCCTIIPTRPGNGAMDLLLREGLFSPPALGSLEEVHEFGINLKAGMVFADTWDLQRFASCKLCFEQRRNRMERMNHRQEIIPPVSCTCSGIYI